MSMSDYDPHQLQDRVLELERENAELRRFAAAMASATGLYELERAIAAYHAAYPPHAQGTFQSRGNDN